MVMYARDIVQSDFLSLTGDTDSLSAAKLMADKHHGFVIVASTAGIPEGIVTEWDYLSKVVAENREPMRIRLAEIMTPNLASVDAGDGIDSIATLMAQRGIRRVLVVEGGKVLGVITASTMLARMKDYIDKISSQIAGLQAPPF
jgi:CBS domain-containing protein